MTYDSQRASYDREHIYIVEVDLDYCPFTHGTSPCTATETGDDKCYNTLATCNDLANYRSGVNTEGISVKMSRSPVGATLLIDSAPGFTLADLGFDTSAGAPDVIANGFSVPMNNGAHEVLGPFYDHGVSIENKPGLSNTLFYRDYQQFRQNYGKTYRFCEARSPHPIGIDAIPSLKSVSLTPAKVDYTGGMGERSSVTLTFDDHPHNDLDIDKYTADRSYIASDRGLFWAKLRARNPNYQFRNLRVLTGYLENGEYKAENFKARHYVIEKLDVSNGRCTIVGKDELKKASDKKAQIPEASKGSLNAAILSTDTSLTLSPGGIGVYYPSSGYVSLSGQEIAAYTRSGDTLTLTRGQYNTTAIDHDIGVVVQLCYQKTDKIDEILKDVLIDYAGVDSRFIDQELWANEVLSNPGIDGNLSGLIAKPTDVNKVIKELAEAKPFSLYWDELNQRINFEVIKPPADTVATIDMDNGLLANSVKVKDRPELRASTVYVTFGQINPTKSLTDPNNYTQTIVRVDAGSIEKYGSNQIKTITSRWITSNSKAVAENAAQLYGRRFADIPREVSFSVDPKDSDLKLGETRAVNHYSMTDFSGSPVDVPLQIISKQESNNFKYIGLEYLFSDAITGDNPIDSTTIKFSINQTEVDLYTEYVAQFGTPGAAVDAVFEVESGVVIGSTSIANYALDTGSAWPSGSTIKLINNGYIVGKGGDSAYSGAQAGNNNGGAGGNSILLNHDLILINSGIIGGGGGGGGGGYYIPGGGGAGYIAGSGTPVGSTETGGTVTVTSSSGGDGGDLGEAGNDSIWGVGGSPGNAITENGYSLDSSSQIGDIRGAII